MKKIVNSFLLLFGSLVLSGCGGKGSSEDKNNLSNSPPSAVIDVLSVLNERSSVELKGNSSTDPDGSISKYLWTIEPVANISISDPTAAITQIDVGELTDDSEINIKLKVTDNDGATAESEIMVRLNEVDYDLLPPDPGFASLNSLEGIDSNENGVRDDVEIAIYNLHKDSFNNREVLKLGSNALQKAMISGESIADQDNDIASELIAKFAYCLSEQTGMNRTKELAMLKSLQFNTEERTTAYYKYNQSRDGTIQRVVEATLDECLAINNSEGM